MRSLNKIVAFTVLTILLAAGAAQAKKPKVDVCHVPPGNPDNFHTITVSVNAVPAHLAHGDFIGACADNCATLCDDGDPCTIDACDPGTEQCASTHPPVDCDDGDLCTADSCDADTGACVNVLAVDCTDGDLCTVDLCDSATGLCENTPAVCDPGEACDPDSGECVSDDPCENNPCQNGDCVPDAGDPRGYICECLPGYIGDNCEIEDPCVGNFCQNGATCVPDAGSSDGYVCDCAPGFTGMYCEIDPCGFNHCQNGGTCIRGDSGTTYTCDCLPGYSGSNCEIEDPQGYSCVENNPCDPLEVPGQFFYPHTDETMFVQCSEFGQCFEMTCPPGTVWDQDALTCVSP